MKYLACSSCWFSFGLLWDRISSWSSIASGRFSHSFQRYVSITLQTSYVDLRLLLRHLHDILAVSEENQKRYAENDARFKESPLLKKLLEKTKLNKEKNRQEILDKYCIRGAEWGVGDCSAEAMSPEDRENFIAMLKKKAGVE